MTLRLSLQVDRKDLELTNTVKTARRLVKESPRLIANEIAQELKSGDGGVGSVPARPDRKTGWAVRTGKSRSGFKPTHDGVIMNSVEYSGFLEYSSPKWAGRARAYIEKRLLDIAEEVRDRVLSRSR